jgi:hypothetical protein
MVIYDLQFNDGILLHFNDIPVQALCFKPFYI